MPNASAEMKNLRSRSEIVGVCFSMLLLLLFSGCANHLWLTDEIVDAHKENPKELMRFLGPPAKLVRNQDIRLHEGSNQEYRYFVLDRTGKAQYRRYFYDGVHWLFDSSPFIEGTREGSFRVIDPSDPSLKEKLNRLWRERPDLRQEPVNNPSGERMRPGAA